jgi:stage V sporulation protein B
MREKKEYKKTSFMQGVLVLMLSQIVIKIIGLVYRLYITNKEGFGDKGNAIYAAGFQIYALLLTLSSIGVPNAVAKLVSAKVAIGDNKGAYRIFKIAFGLFGILGFLGSTILFINAKTIAIYYLQIPEAELTLLALSPSIFLVSISSVLRGYFNGREDIGVTAKSQAVEQFMKTVFTVTVVEIISRISYSSTTLMAARSYTCNYTCNYV